MIKLARFIGNPILSPLKAHSWEQEAVFNGTVVVEGSTYHLLYRAVSAPLDVAGKKHELSTIGHAVSHNRIDFEKRTQLIKPEEEWERYGCEDPRVTKLDDTYYIFYTALSAFPPGAESIKVAVALSRDLDSLDERHLVTPFNAKAMALFPEKVNGKIVVVLTAHTDQPPAKIALAFFDAPQDLWNKTRWDAWHHDIEQYSLPLLRSPHDHIEAGAQPVRTSAGWLLIYCYIRNYLTSNKIFGIEAVLLDLENPLKIIGRSEDALLSPEADYELHGQVPNVIFPSGALIHGNDLGVYYGAADTTVCLATCNLDALLSQLVPKHHIHTFGEAQTQVKRCSINPVISPVLEHSWENEYTFNPAAVYLKNRVHILYRAMGKSNVSVLGYASSRDGVHIDERLSHPVYLPREEFERKLQPGYSGCEDPRLTQMGERLYMCYTAFDAVHHTRVALTSITADDFCQKKWTWERPILISPPDHNDKNACMLPEKIGGKYVFFHRMQHAIWVDYVDDLEFGGDKWLGGEIIFRAKAGTWYSGKVGIGPPPIKTPLGWLLIFHALSKEDLRYRLGAMLLKINDPRKIIAFLPTPILEPEAEYENVGLRSGTVFACGMVTIADQLYIYYGGADKFVCVGTINLQSLLSALQNHTGVVSK